MAALKRLARWCGRFSPVVGLEEAETPEVLLLDITGCAHLFGGEEALARRILRDVAHIGLIAHVAIADTVGAAWAMTFCAAQTKGRLPVPIPAGQQAIALKHLPVEALRLSPDVVRLLYELDLRTIGRLICLPRETLPSRFGSELLRRLDQALGNLTERIVPERPEEAAEARWGCEDPIEDRLAIEMILKRLIGRVLRRVAARGEGILQLDVVLTSPEQEPARMTIGCVRATMCRKHLWDLLRLQLERLRRTRGIVDFWVRANATAPLGLAQPDLFREEDRHDDHREFDALLNRLSSRLGRSAVLRPELHPDHQPERAAGFRPVIGFAKPAISSAKRDLRPVEVANGRCRPVRLLPQAVPVAVTSVVPDGPPIRMSWRNTDHRIVQSDGPERIETGWWRQAPIHRDYYRVDTDSGQRYWLFRQRDDGRWFLHGEF